MLTIHMRPYQGETDLQPIADLVNSCDGFDKLDAGTSVTELRTEFETPSVDQARDLRLWEDGDGRLIGFGSLWITEPSETIDGFLWFEVHPDARGGNVETEIITWAEERMRSVREERGFPVKLRSGVRDRLTERIAILENQGFTSDRYFFRMELSLHEPIALPQFPVGLKLRSMNVEADAQGWVELYDQSFIDHWNYHPITVEDLKHWLSEPTYRAELDLVATTADGTFAAMCHCYIDPDYNERSGRKVGGIGILGTRRGFRRLGLGRAMLLEGLHRLKAAGMDTARLDVDGDNPNGALRLYESVGFTKVHTNISYVKDI
ncbi:MAG: GNAT family N-acetyltransferase [Nostocaceae cyanobacterium]|nr:GNAT family N-acetyltransferase [Nostocaceae cyanobacterium]